MLVAVCLVFAVAFLAPLVYKFARGATGWLLAILPLGLTAYFLSFIGPVSAGETVRQSTEWVPALGVNFSFLLDGLSLVFALLITGIGTLIVIYSAGYLRGNPNAGRFFMLLFLFMGAMLGIVISDNLITLFVFWELTSLSSYLLIGFRHGDPDARAAALQSLLITGGGGLALLAGFLLLGAAAGSLEISAINTMGEGIKASPFYGGILALILIGAFTKSAQFPFHFWLPNAMAAPSPVSAYLHSATMVKAGVFLLARLFPALGGTLPWEVAVSAAGGATMIIGAVLALMSTDLKRMLAYTTVSALGSLVLLLGIGTPVAIKAVPVVLLAHAAYKGALFMVAGSVEYSTGQRDIRYLGGLLRAMPVTAISALLAALSMSGIFLLFGFVAKEVLFEAALEATGSAVVWTFLAVVSAVLYMGIAGSVAIRPFIGEAAKGQTVREAPIPMLVGPLLLAGFGLIVGPAPGLISPLLIAPAASAIAGAPAEVALYLWHGLTPAFLLSALTWTLGLVLFLAYPRVSAVAERLLPLGRYGVAQGYEVALRAMMDFAAWQSRMLQSGALRRYILITAGTSFGAAGITLVAKAGIVLPPPSFDPRVHEATLIIVMVGTALLLTSVASRLTAIVALGVLGYAVSITFVNFGAADLAMTQLCIETLAVVLFVLVLYRLPRFARLSSTKKRMRDALVAACAGALMTIFVLVVGAQSSAADLRDYYSSASYTEAHGRNIVNVILVDFRALDTLGEITVLAVAAVGVYALLRLRPPTEAEKTR